MFEIELRDPAADPMAPYSTPEVMELGEILTLTRGTS